MRRRAKLLLHEKITDHEGGIIEAVVWQVPRSVTYPEGVKYRLVHIPPGQADPDVLYDVHAGKGHHKQLQGKERPYDFEDVDSLVGDFLDDVQRVRDKGDKP
ncbi:MAG TPA: DUF6516 family protein [bacterium]